MNRGILVVLVGPTGSGKSALREHIRAVFPDIVFPINCTTRTMRPGEVPGEKYYFLTEAEFKARVEQGDFLEWASYGGNLYGTLKSEIVPKMAEGKVALTEVEVQGARAIQKILPKDELAIIFIDAGAWDELEKRVRARAPITEDELAKRKKRYADETAFKPEADFVIKNPAGGLDQAKLDIEEAIRALQKRLSAA
jgi:guanylate kinase